MCINYALTRTIMLYVMMMSWDYDICRVTLTLDPFFPHGAHPQQLFSILPLALYFTSSAHHVSVTSSSCFWVSHMFSSLLVSVLESDCLHWFWVSVGCVQFNPNSFSLSGCLLSFSLLQIFISDCVWSV